MSDSARLGIAAEFTHGIRADDEHWSDVWNFSLEGTRASIGVVNATESHTLPQDVALEVLSGPPDAWPSMFLSGFLSTVLQGAIVRTGHRLGRGVPPYPTRWATNEMESKVLRAADRELALEAGRREHASSAPSRLSCLWLAEDTVRGRAWVQQMLGRQAFIMSVRVTMRLAWTRCDASWLDRVHADPGDTAAVAGYWGGSPLGDDPLWEYLLEGQIAAADAEALERLRHYVRVQGPPEDMVTRPARQDAN
jgi:hypothetical protein